MATQIDPSTQAGQSATNQRRWPTLQSLQTRLLDGLAWISDGLEHRTFAALGLLLLCTVSYTALKAYYTLLRCDEVYTLRIAQQPTIAQLISTSRQIDLHPPLHFLAQRLALAVPLPLLLSSRLPSLMATALSMCLIYVFVRRHMGNLLAYCAGVAFWFSPAMDFAWSNRPYALWLCLLALTCVLWQRAGDRDRSGWLVFAILVSTAGMILNYMAGLLCVLPILVAELVRERGKARDFPLLAALLLPCVGGLLYVRQVQDFATNTFAAVYSSRVGTTLEMYGDLLGSSAGVFVVCAVVAALLSRRFATAGDTASGFPRQERIVPESYSPPLPWTPANLSSSERTLAIGLVILPVLFAFLAAARHTQFFERYGICGAIGVSMLAPWILVRLSPYARATAALLVLALPIAAVVRMNDAPFSPSGTWRAYQPTGVTPKQLEQLDISMPIVVAQPETYTEMNERGPDSVLNRTYYVYDRKAAQTFSGSTIFETMGTTQRLLHYKTKVAPLQTFTHAHHSFYLIADYAHPEAWLPRELITSGAKLEYLGKFTSTYEEDDLYMVVMPAM